MTPMQQLFLGQGSKQLTFIDDVFSTYVYTGNSTARSINNGIDFSKGAMVWTKTRSAAYHHNLFDTVRTNGRTHSLASSGNTAAGNYGTDGITSFNSNGFSLGTDTQGALNDNNKTYASWSFAKAPGFFDVVTFTETNSNLSVSHKLGCIPGTIFLKRTDGTSNWWVYHTTMGQNSLLRLDRSMAATDMSGSTYGGGGWLPVTNTNFTFKPGAVGAGAGSEWVAYLFAGGESTQNEAVSVDFDGSDDGLTVPNSSDFSFGSGDFTVEGWAKLDQNTNQNALVGVWRYQNGRRSWTIQTDNSTRKLEFYVNSGGGTVTNHETSGGTVPVGQWFHFAGVRHGNTIKLFINGNKVAETAYTSSLYDNTNDPLIIGNQSFGTDYTDGKISNIRITKGQALYTTSFKVPTEPLTTTSQGATASNVKLLCCNNSSVTGSTVTPTTISNTGSTASTDSPFDDPAAHVFGESGSESVIKCGSYKGNGSSDGVEINLGFEPQWILMKDADDGNANWSIFDSMRGIVDGGNDMELFPNTSGAEDTGVERIKLTPTGFKLETSHNDYNSSTHEYIYMCIRRPDGYVGKLIKAGTNAFNVVYGNSSSTIPNFTSNFPVDMGIYKEPANTYSWYLHTRLVGPYNLKTDSYSAQAPASPGDGDATFDSNAGWGKFGYNTDKASWLWKRHAGFDVVAYKGNGVAGRQMPHSLSKNPEMIWVKKRDGTTDWNVGHKGLNGGTNPWDYSLVLNSTGAEADGINKWNDTAPTSTHFTVGDSGRVNTSGSNYIAMLFASTDVSKVGSYTGNGTGQTITTGFQPRFLLIKNYTYTGGENWRILDTTRGWGSGNDNQIRFSSNLPQSANADWGAPTSTGFTLTASNDTAYNKNGTGYIYYAHA